MNTLRTAFVFPGLNGVDVAEHLPLLQLPAFGAHWRLVQRACAAAPGFLAFDAALHAGEPLPTAPAAWPWRALAIAAMQLAAAEALEEHGEHADWLCSYSIGDVARNCHGGVAAFADVVAFAAALPPLPLVAGATVALLAPSAALADVLATRADAHGVSTSRLSPRFLMFAGRPDAVHDAARACQEPGVHGRPIAGCALHAPLQQPLARLLGHALASASLGRPARAMFSTFSGRPVATAEDVRAEFAANVAVPCDFAATVRRLCDEHGVQRFVDLGPGRHAQRLVRHHGSVVTAVTAGDLLAGHGRVSVSVTVPPAATRQRASATTAGSPGRDRRAS